VEVRHRDEARRQWVGRREHYVDGVELPATGASRWSRSWTRRTDSSARELDDDEDALI